jgi:predicted aspartyl protease
MIFSYEYNGRFSPAMPVIPVSFSPVDDENGLIGEFDAVIDSGADGTLIPITFLKRVGAEKLDKVHMIGIAGHGVWVDIFLVTMWVGPIKLNGMRVIANPAAEIILGRNVLNQLRITLDGPAEMTELVLSP